jgi:hypothetical protein
LIKEQGFEFDDCDWFSYKAVAEGINLFFSYNPDNKRLSDYILGFSFESLSQKTKKNLEDILSGISFKTGSGGEVETFDGPWLGRRFCVNIDKPADELVNDVLDMYAQVTEKVNSANIE